MPVWRDPAVRVVEQLGVADEPAEGGVAAHIVGEAGEGGNLPRQDGARARQRDGARGV